MKSLTADALLLVAAPGLAQVPSRASTLPPKNCTELLARMPSDSVIETKQDAEARAAAVHKRLDLNHDGYVTLDEIDHMAKQATGMTRDLPPDGEAFVRRLFLQGDSNHDGRLSLTEALAGTDSAFAAADTDHDGKVTPAERCAAMTSSLPQLLQTWKSTASH